jgi:uncharacterized protein (TIGR02147 family)
MSKQLGLRSPNHFQLVITRKRHLSTQTLNKIMKLLHPNNRERQYLNLLFKYDQEKVTEKKEELAHQIEQMRNVTLRPDLPEERYQLVGNSLAWFIKMGAIAFDGLKKDDVTALIRRSCPFEIEIEQIHEALASLVALNLMSYDGDLCRFEFGNITTKWDFDRTEIKTHHRNNLNLAIKAIPMEIERRFFNSVTIPCNSDLYEFITTEIRNLSLKVLEESNKRIVTTEQCEKLVTLHFSLFPYFEFTNSKTSHAS